MKQKNEKNFYSLNNKLSSPLSLKKSKNIYKNYIYRLFRYNQDKRKKTNIKENEMRKINSIIKNINTPRKDKTNIYSFLHINTIERKKMTSLTPKNLKNQNLINKIKYQNNISISNISNTIPNKKNKNFYKSRNFQNCLDLINTKNNSINKLLTNSRIKTIDSNENNKCFFLMPKSKKITQTETINNNSVSKYNNYTIFQNKNKFISESYMNKTNNINNNKKNIFKPTSKNKKNKLKVILYKECNDMRPIYRFSKLKRELLLEDTKINKMFMKFKTQISKNERLIKFQLIKDKENLDKNNPHT